MAKGKYYPVRRNPDKYVLNSVKRNLFTPLPMSANMTQSVGKPTYSKRKDVRDHAPKSKVRIVQTPGRSLVAPKKQGAVSSKSGGRLYSRRYRYRKRDKIAASGISYTREVGKESVTTTQVLWIGHNTGAYMDLRKNMWRLIIKKLSAKSQFVLRNFESIAEQITAGDIFQVRYTSADATAATITHTYVASQTWDTIAATFYNSASLNTVPGVTLNNIVYIPTVNAVGAGTDRPPCRIDLENTYISVYMKSSMKIQNRTQNGTDTNMEDLDNVPVYGRVYGGNGNGTVQFVTETGAPNKQLIADSQTGYIEGDANDAGLKEPIPQIFFPNVTQSGKIHLDPGVVKTSVLVFKKTLLLNRLREYLGFDSSLTKSKAPFGKFRFFGIERMINTSATTNVTCGWEINHYMSLNMWSKFSNITTPIFETSFP